MAATLETTATQYIQANNGVVFAYRRLGVPSEFPLVMHIHFRANMDFWDPSLVNALAAKREVIIFDSAGIGRSTGEVPTTFRGWAGHLIALVKAIKVDHFDLLGFSMGGIAVQEAALMVPSMVRSLILAGTRPAAAVAHSELKKGLTQIRWDSPPLEPIIRLSTAITAEEGKDAITVSFFPHTETGRQDAEKYWERLGTRTLEPVNLILLDKDTGGKNQMSASRLDHAQAEDYRFVHHGSKDLSMPVLVANGDDDLLIPTARSWDLFSKIGNAKLVIYPHAGHGFLWQCSEAFAEDVDKFLDAVKLESKL